MKVVIIKECKDGKVNDIVNVKDGYGKNFLIRNGFALPYNQATKKMADISNKKIEDQNRESKKNSEKVKNIIEKMKLQFKLKVTNDVVVHGSITKKQIMQMLLKHGIHLPNHAIENVHISSLGVTNVTVKLQQGVIAKLKVEVING